MERRRLKVGGLFVLGSPKQTKGCVGWVCCIVKGTEDVDWLGSFDMKALGRHNKEGRWQQLSTRTDDGLRRK